MAHALSYGAQKVMGILDGRIRAFEAAPQRALPIGGVPPPMTMTGRVRKLALSAHVTSSVGWLGAVAGFLALALAGLTSEEAQMVRACYLAMELTGWFVIVPLSLASLPTGLVMSLGTEWGLFRHYWVVAKLLITILATVLLLVHMRPIGHLAGVVAATTLAHGELAGLRLQLVVDAGAALLALLTATALSVYKPRGMTAYGRRKLSQDARSPSGARVLVVIAVLFALLLVLLHLTGGGLGSH